MTIRLKIALACSISFGLSACTAPRSAGFQSEITRAQSESSTDATTSFEVVAVTRDSQAAIDTWPSVNQPSHQWLRHTAQPDSMLIATGDRIAVTVWDTEDNSLLAGAGGRVAQLSPAVVSSQGKVFLPFIGDVSVSGNSPESARTKIEELYAETIPSAQVQVEVTPGRSNTVNLVSGMGAPGVYPLESRNITLLAVVAQAGGIPAGLSNPQVKLMRGNSIYSTAVDRLYANPDLDPTLIGGDRIIIEEDSKTFLSLGAAGTQAEHVFPEDDLTALQAISTIGGVDAGRANPAGVLILREYPGSAVGHGPTQKDVVFTIDLTSADGLFAARNFKIMPGDVVYATESPLGAARSVLGLIGTAFGIADNF